MEDAKARTLDLRLVLAAAAVAAVALTLWATGAFAAGGSSDPSGGSPSAFIQSGDDGQAPRREDCPKDRGGGGGAPQDGSGSDAPSL